MGSFNFVPVAWKGSSFFLNQENLISWVSKFDVRGGKIKHKITAAVETVFLALEIFERLFPRYYQRRLLLTAQSMEEASKLRVAHMNNWRHVVCVHTVAVTIVRTGVVLRGHELCTYLQPPTLTTDSFTVRFVQEHDQAG